MKVAFVGKGGSGKTTVSSLLARYLAMQNSPVLAIDADINQHLGASLGFLESELTTIPHLGNEIGRIKDFLRGKNTLISSQRTMTKTTPPGTGSRLLQLQKANSLFDYFAREQGGVRFMAVGPFTEEDLGVSCYHSKTGAVELLLNHLIDTSGEYVIVDMTAGADSFASGLFTRFDLTLLVVEPTLKSLGVYQQYKKYAADFDVSLKVIGNKIEDEEDVSFITSHLGEDLIGTIGRSQYVRSLEKGSFPPLEELESENRDMLARVVAEIDAQKKDWGKFYDQAVFFHRRNAQEWANAQVGEDLTKQIDPNFSLERIVNDSTLS